MRFSKQRELILRRIQSTGSHPTAEWIFNEVKKEKSNISFGTVYRNLSQLVEHGLARIIQINGIAHYDGNMNPHNHFICNECCQIYDVELEQTEFITELELKTNHHVSSYHLKVRGTCKKCKPN
jgi:Fur family peroxide stress response transcriptional regulator